MRIFYPGNEPTGVQPLTGRPWPVLRLDQIEAIYRIIHEVTDPALSGSVLVGAGMGSGKTVVTSEVILKTAPKRVLIVGVRDSYDQWANQLRDQGSTTPLWRIESSITGDDNLKRLLDGDDGHYFVGLEYLRAQDWAEVTRIIKHDPELAKMFGLPPEYKATAIEQVHLYKKMKPVDLLISDESHKHSNQQSASIDTIKDIPARKKIALSGTFFGNKFENAWALCTWLWGKKVIGTKGDFEADYCIKEPIMSKDGRSQLKTPKGFPLTKVLGERNPGDYVETLPCYVFIESPLGPPPKPEIVRVELGPEQTRQYIEMEDQSLTWIPEAITRVREPLVADMPVTQRIRLRTAALGAMTLVKNVDPTKGDKITFAPGCISSTLNAAYEVLHRPTWVGRKVLILTHSLPFANETARRIEVKYPGQVFLKTGATGKRWKADKESFMRPVSETGPQFLVAVISAVGTATDGLQANCSKVLWLSEDENNVNNIQGSNRVWRDGVEVSEYECVKIVQRNTIAEAIIVKNNSHRTRTLTSVAGSK